MILFKNYEGQVVYTTIVDLFTGLPIEDDVVTAYLSKDGGYFVQTSNSVTEITDVSGNGYGVYAVTLTANETNCDTGVVVFSSTLLEASGDSIAASADSVYFQTSSTTPSVSIANGTYGFNTSGFVGSVSGNVGGSVTGNVAGYVGGIGSVNNIEVSQIATDDFFVDNIYGRNAAIINIIDPLADVSIYGNLEITGAIKANNISGYSSANTTITGNVAGNLNGNVSGFVSGSVKGNVDGSVGSVTGNVGGNVVGNVNGNVVGSVASVTNPVTVGTNNDKTGYTVSTVSDKTGYSLASSQSFSTTGGVGYVTGNVSGYTYGVSGDVVGNVSGFVSGSVKGNVDGSVSSVVGAVGSVTGNVGGNVVGSVASVVGAVGSVTGAVGSVTGNVGGNVVGSVASVVGAVGSVTGAVGSVTGNVGGNVVGSVGSVSSATSIITAIKSATYDSITQEKLYEIILAFIANKVTITSAGVDTQTISYKKRDGSTEVLSVTVSTTDGARSSGGSIT